MTVGEKIQYYRKLEKMSQEELGQKLLVSRQTVSLWENGQTLPTIDNLVKLKEIFNVTIDELLCENECSQTNKTLPKESYTFKYSSEEIKQVHKAILWNSFRLPLIFSVILIFYLLYISGTTDLESVVSASTLIIIVLLITNIRYFFVYRKNFKKSKIKLIESTYKYDIYEDHVLIEIYRNQELTRSSKHYYSDLEKIQDIGKFLLLQFNNELFIVRKSDLEQASLFHKLHANHPKNKNLIPVTGKWKTLSTVLFVASILSFFAALSLISALDITNGMNTDLMWIFFLFLPIPIASIILGFKLKFKGFKGTKNIVTGFIIAFILCIYGSFSFIFADTYDDSSTYIIEVETQTGIEFPEHTEIVTHNWSSDGQTSGREHIYYRSNVFFDSYDVIDFEKQLATDERWVTSFPNEYIGILPYIYSYATFDHAFVYNTDTEEFNTIPSENGTYRFIFVFYDSENNEMQMIEYDMEYIN